MSENSGDQVFQKGKVTNTCKEFLLKADELLAHKLQDEEFFNHYDKNRQHTKAIRTDLPVAKNIQNSEYKQLLMRHQMLEQIEKEDALIAFEIQKQLIKEETNEMIIQQKIDKEIAKKLQAKEILNENNIVETANKITTQLASNLSLIDNPYDEEEQEDQDLKLARKLQEEERSKLKIKQKIETQDERLAREIQEQEKLALKTLNKPKKLEIKQKSKSSSSSSLNSLSSSDSFLTITTTTNTTTTMPVEIKHQNSTDKYTTNEYEKNLLIDLCESSTSLMKQTLAKETSKSEEDLSLITNSKINESFESFKTTSNIVEFIDPTFKKCYNQSSNTLTHETNQKLINKEVIYDLKSETSNYYDSNLDDTEMFLPVQGQKRLNSTIKSVKKNKKSNQSQCLQQ